MAAKKKNDFLKETASEELADNDLNNSGGEDEVLSKYLTKKQAKVASKKAKVIMWKEGRRWVRITFDW